MLDPKTTADADIAAVLVHLLGADRVIVDPVQTAVFAQDIYSKGAPVACVASPSSTDELSKVVSAATERGIAVVPRGGGMSYTGGYLATEGGSVLVDTARMDRILEINVTDMTVTVQCGVTWKQLNDALRDKGLRTPFWGPFSGLHATVAGSVSQNSISHGSGAFGISAQSVLSVDVVLASGAGSARTTPSSAPGSTAPRARASSR